MACHPPSYFKVILRDSTTIFNPIPWPYPCGERPDTSTQQVTTEGVRSGIKITYKMHISSIHYNCIIKTQVIHGHQLIVVLVSNLTGRESD